MSERARCMRFVLAAVLMWSIGGLGIKLVDADPLAISGFRSLFSLPILTGWMFLSGGGEFRRALARMKRPTVIAAGAFYSVTVILFVAGNKWTTAANTILLQSVSPVYVALLSWPLLRERITALDWLAVGGSLAGMAFFFGDKLTPSGTAGNAAAIGAGVGFAVFMLLLRMDQLKIVRDGEPHSAHLAAISAVVLGNVFSVAVGLPWMISSRPSSAIGWGALIVLGTIQIGLSYLFFTAGVRRLTAVETSLLTLVEPLLNPLWVMLGTGETPSRAAVIGGFVIIFSVTARGVFAGRGPIRPPIERSME